MRRELAMIYDGDKFVTYCDLSLRSSYSAAILVLLAGAAAAAADDDDDGIVLMTAGWRKCAWLDCCTRIYDIRTDHRQVGSGGPRLLG